MEVAMEAVMVGTEIMMDKEVLVDMADKEEDLVDHNQVLQHKLKL